MAALPLIDDCFIHDKDRLRHKEALDILRKNLNCIVGTLKLPIEHATDRMLADEVKATHNVPLNDNSAMDGYAYQAADYGNVSGRFPLSGRIAAGDLNPPPLANNTAVRIFTGAIMPAGADTVAMQEDCQISQTGKPKIVTIPAGLAPGANRRLAGEDIAADDVLLLPGQRLRPQEIAALASIGRSFVKVFDKLKIALISTGNEIRRPGEPIRPGEVYDSNHYLLRSLLQTTCSNITDCGVIKDTNKAVGAALKKASKSHHVIITTGGASRGEEDHVIATLDRIGKRHLWQMAIKPGRPMTFGQISQGSRDCLFFGLPGNPVAAMVCFLFYVKPALDLLAGGNWREPVRYPLPAMFDIPNKKPDRREFLRGTLKFNKAGNPGVSKFSRDGSGIISSLRDADGLIEIAEDTTQVRRGNLVNFIPFSEFGISR